MQPADGWHSCLFHALSVPRLQVPSANLADKDDTATCKPPRCPAGLQKLKLKIGRVTVAASLCDVLDDFIADKGFETIEKLLGALLPLFHLSMRSCFCGGSHGI